MSFPRFLFIVLCSVTAAAGVARAQTTERISVSSAGVQGDASSIHSSSITPDGRFVAFQSDATNLVAGDTNGFRDIFVRDRLTNTTTRVSVSSAGAQANDYSFNPSISADGRFVAFMSYASNLVAGDTNNTSDIFLHDRVTGQTTRRSVSTTGTQANFASDTPFISADGRFITFISQATTLVPLANTSVPHIFVNERATGVTTLISVAFDGTLANGVHLDPCLSADGRYLAFTSDANNLIAGPPQAGYQVWVRDRVLGTTTLVSRSSAGIDSNGWCFLPMISANGRVIAFQSDATNLVPGDTNTFTDVFVRDLDTSTTERVSVSSAGAQANSPSGGTGQPPGLSADGRFVTFSSSATNLVPGTIGWTAIFRRDRALGQTSWVSLSTTNAQANNTSLQPVMSSDGRFVVFTSLADNLVPGDTNFGFDMFVRGPFVTQWTNLGSGLAGVSGVPNLLGAGTLVAGSPGSVVLSSARPSSPAILFLSLTSTPVTVQCGTLVPMPYAAVLAYSTDPLGTIALPWAAWPAGLSGLSVYFQYALSDPAAACGVAFSNALRGDAQ